MRTTKLRTLGVRAAKALAARTGVSVKYLDYRGQKRIALAGVGAPITTKPWDRQGAEEDLAALVQTLTYHAYLDARSVAKKASGASKGENTGAPVTSISSSPS